MPGDDDLFGPPPEPPHPVEARGAQRPAPVYAEIDPRNLPRNVELKKKIAADPYWQDVCTCSVGDPSREITELRKPKCCKVCPWCSMRIKHGYYDEHTAYCSAPDRSIAPVPWWRVSSPQPHGRQHAKPISETGPVHASRGARVETGSGQSAAGGRRQGIRGGGQSKGRKKK